MPMGSSTSSPTNQHGVLMEQSVEQGSASGPLPVAVEAVVDGAAVDAAEAKPVTNAVVEMEVEAVTGFMGVYNV